jgi:hypothetical protein
MDFTEGLPEETPALVGVVVPKPLAKRAPGEIAADIAMEILDDTTRIIDDALAFADISADEPTVPVEWVKQYGRERAEVRFRTAKYALMSAKEAPVGLKIAAAMGTAIIKAKAAEPAVTNILNIEKVVLTTPLPSYPELELEE